MTSRPVTASVMPQGQQKRSRMRPIQPTKPADAIPARANAAVFSGTNANTAIQLARAGIRPVARALLGRLFPGARIAGPRPRPVDASPAGKADGAGESFLVVPEGLEECGWGLIDWRALPGRVAIGLLRAADRIARDGHAVAFTGQEYQAGPELKVDGHLTVTRYLGGQAASTVRARDLLAALLADPISGAARIAVVCDHPELSEHDASEVITSLRLTSGPGRIGGLDIYGYDWTVHA